MKFELFIVKRIISRQPDKKRGVRSLINISVGAIGLSLTIMIFAIAILFGFKKEIKRKLSGFSAHIQVTQLNSNNSYESFPVQFDETFKAGLDQTRGIRRTFTYATKPVLLKSGIDIQGGILYGVDASYDWRFFEDYLVDGELPLNADPNSLQILISSTLAQLLHLQSGDRLPAYFIQDPPKMRPFTISGIYDTGIIEYDKLYVICALDQIRQVNDWASDEIGGYGIILDDPDNMETMAEQVRDLAGDRIMDRTELMRVTTIREIAPGFFDFLRLTDMNVWVMLVLMGLVAGFNMISGLMILILDRTRMIGTLRALGTKTRSLRKIFIYQSAVIIGKGLVLGNLLGIGLTLLQKKFELIPLDPSSYFIDTVPISLSPLHLILLNIGTLIVTVMMLLVPSGIISRLSPDKTIKFD